MQSLQLDEDEWCREKEPKSTARFSGSILTKAHAFQFPKCDVGAPTAIKPFIYAMAAIFLCTPVADMGVTSGVSLKRMHCQV